MNFATYHGGSARGNRFLFGSGTTQYGTIWLDASVFQPCPQQYCNNPAWPEVIGVDAGFFRRVITFPRPTSYGGAWAQASVQLPDDLDTGEFPKFRIVWTSYVGVSGIVNWHIHWTSFPDGTAWGGGGAGTHLNDSASSVPECLITDEYEIVPTGGGAYLAGSVAHINVYRGLVPPDTLPGHAHLLGVRIRYRKVRA